MCSLAMNNILAYDEEFILYMNQFGYDINWQNTRKYITYTTPEGMKCRDNKLHEE